VVLCYADAKIYFRDCPFLGEDFGLLDFDFDFDFLFFLAFLAAFAAAFSSDCCFAWRSKRI
jgi:hypothetical protein